MNGEEWVEGQHVDEIDPPNSAAGFHRQPQLRQIENSNDQGSKVQTENQLLQQKRGKVKAGCRSWCSLDSYRQYFEVKQAQVFRRIKAALRVPPHPNFIGLINQQPDLYGPFWIMTTLVLLLGTVGNLSNYILSVFSNSTIEGYFFRLQYIRYAVGLIYCLGLGVPVGIYLLLNFTQSQVKVSLAQVKLFRCSQFVSMDILWVFLLWGWLYVLFLLGCYTGWRFLVLWYCRRGCW